MYTILQHSGSAMQVAKPYLQSIIKDKEMKSHVPTNGSEPALGDLREVLMPVRATGGDA